MNNKTTDGRDKSKLLLERLRMLEKENSSLVLENEQQRQQYEKCLDEIANQVLQYQKLTCETSQVLLAGVSGGFSRGSPILTPPTD